MRSPPSPVKVGSIVLMTMAVGLGGTIALSKIDTGPRTKWEIICPLDIGMAGIHEGSVVLVGGIDMGRVTEVIPQEETPDAAKPRSGEKKGGRKRRGANVGMMLAKFELRGDLQLYSNARIVRESNPVSGAVLLDVISLGTPGASDGAESGRRKPLKIYIPADDTPGGMLGPKDAENAHRIRKGFDDLKVVFMGAEPPIDPATDEELGVRGPSEFGDTMESFRCIAGNIRSDVRRWVTCIDQIRTELETLKAEIGDPNASPPTGIRGRLAQLDPRHTGSWDVADSFKRFMADASGVGARFSMLKSCFGFPEQISLIGQTFKTLFPEIDDGLRAFATGFSLASGQIWIGLHTDFMGTVSRALPPPSEADYTALTLLQASSRVGVSGADLEAAIHGVEGVMAQGGGPLTPEARERLQNEVLPAMQRYRRDLADTLRILDSFVHKHTGK